MERLKMRTFDGVAAISFMILTPLFLTLPSALIDESGNNAWLTLLISALILLPLFMIMLSQMKRYQNLSIIEIVTLALGKPVGYIYKVIIALYFSAFAGRIISETAELLNNFGFDNTPLYITCIFFVLTAVLMALLGKRGLFKTVSFFFMSLIIGFICAVLVGLNRYDPTYLAPVSIDAPLINSALQNTWLFGGLLLLFLYMPNLSPKRANKSGLIALALSAGIGTLFMTCYIMMFSAPVARSLNFGYMEMGKTGYYNHFFYRFESVFMIFAIIAVVISASISIFSAAGTNGSRPFIIICGLFTLMAALAPLNWQMIFIYATPCVFAVPLIAFIMGLISNKRVIE